MKKKTPVLSIVCRVLAVLFLSITFAKAEKPNVLFIPVDDIPSEGIKMAKPDGDHAAILKSGRWKEAVQAYLATIHFADAQLGRLLDALDKSPDKGNTIVCLWSDHGWHLGEKQHWRKFALWEEAAKAPMIWVVPGVTPDNGVCARPVDFMNIYNTFLNA